MATTNASIALTTPPRRTDWLGRAATFCYLTIAAGQLLFLAFILLYYYARTLSGNFAGWNDKPIITGYVAGDTAGNIFFAVHVLLAAVITFGGLVQLFPVIRNCWPALHRWNGRLYRETLQLQPTSANIKAAERLMARVHQEIDLGVFDSTFLG